MKPMDYFKLQAKNLFKDFKTQTVSTDDYYDYNPRYFDVNAIVMDYDLNEDKFTLMNAQHVIAKIAGFNKWTDMLGASDSEQDLAKLLFDNQHKISADEWKMYLQIQEEDNKQIFDPEFRLEIFREVFANVETHQSMYQDYRLNFKPEQIINMATPIRTRKISTGIQITSLPLDDKDRKEFIETAKAVFENVMERIEPDHPELTRELWNPEFYLDNVFFSEVSLPIDRDYALSLIDATLVHHVIEIAARADDVSEGIN